MKRKAATTGRPSAFAIEASGLAVAWLALLALMATSLGTSYLHLGAGNVVASIGIALVKTFVVGWWFMHFGSTSAANRVAALIALFMLSILLTLSGLDYLTRLEEPAAIQVPRQIEPLIGNDTEGQRTRITGQPKQQPARPASSPALS